MEGVSAQTLAVSERRLKPISALVIVGCDLACGWFLAQGFGSAPLALWLPCALVAGALCLLATKGLLGAGAAIGGMPVVLFALAPATLPAALRGGGTIQGAATAIYFLSCLLIAFFRHWSHRMSRAYAQAAPIAPDAALIVLGGYVVDGAPVRTVQARLRVAAQLWHESPRRLVLLSGGPTPDGTTTEADVMGRWLETECALPADAILKETEATNTEENLRLSHALLERLGQDGRQVCIVSSDYHLFRALAIAERLGIEATCAPAPVPIRSRLQQWCREVLILALRFR